MKQVTASVISNKKILKGITHRSGRAISSVQCVWLNCPEIVQEAKPGQFVMVRCGEEYVLPRPFSIHQVNGDSIALFFNVWKDGKGTNWLSQSKIGDNIDLLGPLGNSYSIHPESHNLLLVAGGMGIAPLRFLAQQALQKGYSVTLLYGTANKNRYPLPTEIEVVVATEDGSAGKKGRITEFIPEYIDWADQIFACGPLPMYQAMAQMPELKDKPVQISLEVRMGCGRGVCYGCTVKTKGGLKQVCQDGPVFDLDDVLWDELADSH